MPPLMLDVAVPGCDSYVWSLPPVTPGISHSWSYQGSMRSLRWSSGGIVKMRNAFTAHRSPDAFYSLIEAGASKGVYRPSSYSSFFHDCYRSPRPSGPARRAMAWPALGAWERLLVPRGDYPGTWYRYDLRSAYLWSLASGLPNPSSYRYTERVNTRRDGLYVMDGRATPGAPYPYDRAGCWPVMRDEIERYGIRGQVRYGITWTEPQDIGPMLRAIYDWPFWKEVGRAYWGRWAATAPLECSTYDANGTRRRRWELPATHANPIWAHIILSRVRARLHDITRSANVARVYVDSVIVDRPLESGSGAPGDWRLECQYEGLRILNLHRITSLQENVPYVNAA